MSGPAESRPDLPPAYGRDAIAAGFRRTLPIAASVGVYGVVLGVIAQGKGMTVFELTLMGFIVFAGSAQFVAADLWTPPSLPILEIVLATAVVNSRYLLIGASLRGIFARRTLRQKLVGMHLVSDENWAFAMAEARRRPTTPGFLLGGGLAILAFWIVGSAFGHLAGGGLPPPETLGLDFAFTAAFIALAVGMRRDLADLGYWAVAAAAAIVAAALLPGKWFVLVGALAGCAAVALVPPRRQTQTSPVEPEEAP